MINDWLIDDKGRNILYKTDGEERYPEFKLYKMITHRELSDVTGAQLDLYYKKAYEYCDKAKKLVLEINSKK